MTENDEISEQERQRLLGRLHRSLFWVGEQIPRKLSIKGKDVNLHEIIWEIVNKPELDKDDLKDIDTFLDLLHDKEKEYEKLIESEHLSHEEAKELFDRAAGVRRAIMDLKELEMPSRRKAIFKSRHICKEVHTDEWDSLADTLREKRC